MAAVTLYGITTCDTVRKARRWLEANGVDYVYRDLRADGVDRRRLEAWCRALGWETLVNRRGATWRALPAAARESLDEARAVALMLEHPTLIKRPVLLDHDGAVHVGFRDGSYRELFA